MAQRKTPATTGKDWNDYMQAYEEALNATSRPWAPWYAIPADNKLTSNRAILLIQPESSNDICMITGLIARVPRLHTQKFVAVNDFILGTLVSHLPGRDAVHQHL